MNTLRQYVSDVRSAFKQHSPDVDLSDRQIANELVRTNLKLVNQSLNKRIGWNSPNLFTALPCIPMMEVPLVECCDISSECNIARSVKKLPSIADSKFSLVVQGVWSVNKRAKYKEINPDRYSNYLDLALKNPNEKFFWVLDNYLYITDPSLEMASMSAFFAEPMDFTQYSCDAKERACPTNPLDMDFKTLPFLKDDIVTITYKKLLETFLRVKADAYPSREEEYQGGQGNG